MGRGLLISLAVSLLLGWAAAAGVVAGEAPHAVLKAKQEAESRGYLFFTSHEQIVAGAKKEGRVRALSNLDRAAIKAMSAAFKKKYPFIDVYVEEIGGSEAFQRFLLEVKSGTAKNWDANAVNVESYNEFLPYQKKFDILGMAEHGVLNIPTTTVDPIHRNIVALSSAVTSIAYNRSLMPPETVPSSWEGLLAPELKGRRVLLDVRPTEIARLVPAWGLEKTLDFARKLAAQEPIWVRGGTRTLTAMTAGEYGLFVGPGLHSVKGVQAKDPTGNLQYKLFEPIPVGISDTDGILASAAHPYAALLWIEFQASPEGQTIIDEYDYQASIFSPGSIVQQATRGKKLSLAGWDHRFRLGDYQAKVFEAYGFPKAERRK
jgi:ABC-type Fe3+ transport system substrate-binding protein